MQVIERHLDLFHRELNDWKPPDGSPADIHEMVAICLSLWELFKDRLRKRVPLDTDADEIKAAYANRDLVIAFQKAFESLSTQLSGAQHPTQLTSAFAEVTEMLSFPLEEIIEGHRQAR